MTDSSPRGATLDDLSSPELVAMINDHLGGFDATLGLQFVEARPDELVAELVIGAAHLQPYGLVHGGVMSAMVETVASVGAALTVIGQGRNTVGLENSTSFLRGVRSGTLRATGRARRRGRRTQVWSVEIEDEQGELVATGRVRLLVLEPGARAGGEPVTLASRGEESETSGPGMPGR